MSQNPQVVTVRQPTNMMGVVGFILSLLGWLSCGILCPIGLIFSLIGLRRQPRGFAIAGTVLGLLGCFWGIVAIFFGGAIAVLACCGGVCGGAAPHLSTNIRMEIVADDVERFARTHGRMPADLQEAVGQRRGKHLTHDAWDRPLRLHLEQDGSFTITSDGPDGVADTPDDMRSHHEQAPKPIQAL